MDQKTIRFLKNLSTGLVVAAVGFAFLIAGIRIFGIQVYGVLTGSMEPEYPIGSMIYVKAVDTSELRTNDVITFSVSPNVIVTHRIVRIEPDENNPSIVRYRTKGDANEHEDAALVSPTDVIGKAIFNVPKLGYIASYIQEPPGLYVAIFVCGLMIAFVFYTDSLENKMKQKGAPGAAPSSSGNFFNKLLGKKNQAPAAPAYRPGYAPQQGYQQQPYYAQQAQQQGYGYQQTPQYPQQYQQPQQQYQQMRPQYPQQYQQPQYPQQQYQQQYQQPQQQYSQQYQQPQYPQQQYPQQYQQPQQQYSQQYQQPKQYPQQGYTPPPYGTPVQPGNDQQRNRRSGRM